MLGSLVDTEFSPGLPGRRGYASSYDLASFVGRVCTLDNLVVGRHFFLSPFS